MKQDYTIAELQAEIAALQQLFDCVTLADPCRGLLDPATCSRWTRWQRCLHWTPTAAVCGSSSGVRA